MNSRVGAAASGDVAVASEHRFRRVAQHALNGDGVRLYLKAGELCALFVTAKTDGRQFRLFVRDAATNALVAGALFDNTEETRHELDFKVPADGNYLLGVESADFIGSADVYEVEFAGNTDTGTDYDRVTKQGGKILYYYDAPAD